MSKVIKNNDGVAVVEGTPAASLVKDVDKFFASKPPERMAGQSISQPRKIDPRAINTRSPIRSNLQSERTDEERAEVTARREKQMEERKLRAETLTAERQETPRRNEARDKAESRRRRFFERGRSRKEAERSQNEQEATQGKFITTLRR